jgi:peroxiredoxin
MMLKFLRIAICLLPNLVYGQAKPYTIVGQVNDPKAAKVFLYVADIVKDSASIDSAEVVEGHFKFQGVIGAPLKAILFTHNNKNRIDFFLEQGIITVRSLDSLDNALLTGGALNRDFLELRKMTDPLESKRREARVRYKAIIAASPEKERDVDFEAKASKEIDSLNAQIHDTYKTFVSERTDNLAAIYALALLAGTKTDVSVIKPLFDRLSESVRNSPYGLVYGEKLSLLNRLDVGLPAPQFSQTDTAGKMVALKDFKGKYVLLDFWASWCGPCREEHPNLVSAYKEYHTKNFTILSVSIDGAKAKSAWLKAITKDGLLWTQLSDLKGWKNDVALLYGVEAVPTNFLIDPNGVIVAKNLRRENLNHKLAELFDK